MENTLVRSAPCPECGAKMLWTQNAWKVGEFSNAAYRCTNGHVLDPAVTRQCPACGVHDTEPIAPPSSEGIRCNRCKHTFSYPRTGH